MFLIGKERLWTVYCSAPETPRGQYDEEIDVVGVRTATQAKHKALAILQERGDTHLKIRKVVLQIP